MLDKVVGAGANQVNGISFELSDRASPADQALKAAVAEATRKAGVMAEAANLKLVRLVSLSTEESRPIPTAPLRRLSRKPPFPSWPANNRSLLT